MKTIKLTIKKVDTVEECISCNSLLEDLIKFESVFDKSVNKDYKIDEWYERTLNKQDTIIFVAKYEDYIIGYVMAYKQKENPVNKRNIITIMNTYINKDYQNKGVGTKLFNEVEKWGNSICDNPMFELDCYVENVNALSFYKKLGYAPIRVKMRKN